MAETNLIIPIVVAVISLLGSCFSLLLSWIAQKRTNQQDREMEESRNERSRELEKLKTDMDVRPEEQKAMWSMKSDKFRTELETKRIAQCLTFKYSQRLLVAANDLQQRLKELVEHPISRQALTKAEGIEDLKIVTCYLLAQYLAWTHILRSNTVYLGFSESMELHGLRHKLYMIDEELDRRRDVEGKNVGVWPAARILVCERMLVKSGSTNDALDGGIGVEVKGLDQFCKEWEKEFMKPMGYYCEWIDLMLEGRIKRDPQMDAPIRCLQHQLVDLIDCLDQKRAYFPWEKDVSIQTLKCKRSTVYCDCNHDGCQGGREKGGLKYRQDARLNDAGLFAFNGLNSGQERGREKDTVFDLEILKGVKEKTYKLDLT